MRFLGIAAVAVLSFAGMMTSPAMAVGPDGFVAKILPSSRSDGTWHGDWVTITAWTLGSSGWTSGAEGTLHIYMPQQSTSVTDSSSPPGSVDIEIYAEVTVWEEVATVPFVGDGTRTFVGGPRLIDRPDTPYTPTRFSVSLADGRTSWYSQAANNLITTSMDAADIAGSTSVGSTGLRNTN